MSMVKRTSFPVEGLSYSRYDLFNNEEKEILLPLLSSTFEYLEWKTVKVARDFSFISDKIHYSMPKNIYDRKSKSGQVKKRPMFITNMGISYAFTNVVILQKARLLFRVIWQLSTRIMVAGTFYTSSIRPQRSDRIHALSSIWLSKRASIRCSLSEAALGSCAVRRSIHRNRWNAVVRMPSWQVNATILMSATRSLHNTQNPENRQNVDIYGVTGAGKSYFPSPLPPSEASRWSGNLPTF